MLVTARVGVELSALFRCNGDRRTFKIDGFSSNGEAKRHAADKPYKLVSTSMQPKWKFMDISEAKERGLEYSLLS